MKYIIIIAFVLSVLGCKKTTQGGAFETDRKIDSLEMLSIEKDKQMNSLVSALIEIDDNLQKIKAKENLITINVKKEEAKPKSIEERVNRDIYIIYELMLENKEQISKLEKQLSESSSDNANLSNLITRLNKQLREKTLEIINIQQQLKNNNLQVADLNFTLEGLQYAVDSLEIAKQATQQQLDETIEKLYRGYYAFGTKKELKAENIISNEGFLSKNKLLTGEYSMDYFTEIDTRDVDSIPLFMSNAKVLTNHPETSFSLESNKEGNMTLRISNKEDFWSLTKYLVVQVN